MQYRLEHFWGTTYCHWVLYIVVLEVFGWGITEWVFMTNNDMTNIIKYISSYCQFWINLFVLNNLFFLNLKSILPLRLHHNTCFNEQVEGSVCLSHLTTDIRLEVLSNWYGCIGIINVLNTCVLNTCCFS